VVCPSTIWTFHGLDAPVVAMEVSRQGMTDVSTQKPLEYVFLVLSPAGSPETQIEVLWTLARTARSGHLLLKIKSCRSPEEALPVILDWESCNVGAAP
jgi:two-component system sensor histidine kinase KdpD